jgi:carbonic anhydrase
LPTLSEPVQQLIHDGLVKIKTAVYDIDSGEVKEIGSGAAKTW